MRQMEWRALNPVRLGAVSKPHGTKRPRSLETPTIESAVGTVRSSGEAKRLKRSEFRAPPLFTGAGSPWKALDIDPNLPVEGG